METYKFLSRMARRLLPPPYFMVRKNRMKNTLANLSGGMAMAQTTIKAPSTGVSALHKATTKGAPPPKGLHLTHAQAAKVQKVQDSLTAGRKGGNLFGLKD